MPDPVLDDPRFGGPAFPTNGLNEPYEKRHPRPGMTLLDYFAGQALVGALASDRPAQLCPDEIARDAYAHAQEMMKLRAQIIRGEWP